MTTWGKNGRVVGQRNSVTAEFRQKLAWRLWRIVFTRDLPDDVDGLCDSQTDGGRPRVGKKILIRDDLRGQDFLDTLFHESLHAAIECLNEECVERVAADLAQLVCRPVVLRRLLADLHVQSKARKILSDIEVDLLFNRPRIPKIVTPDDDDG